MSERNAEIVINRRRHRSPVTREALALQLESACARYDFDAMVLADDEGAVVASAGRLPAHALGAPPSPTRGRDTVSLRALALGDAPVTWSSIESERLRARLFVLARPGRRVMHGLEHATRGVERILGNTAERVAERSAPKTIAI